MTFLEAVLIFTLVIILIGVTAGIITIVIYSGAIDLKSKTSKTSKTIGMVYNTDDTDTAEIFQDVQNVLTLLQKENCGGMSAVFTEQKDAMIQQLRVAFARNPPLSCTDALPSLRALTHSARRLRHKTQISTWQV